MIDAVRGRVRAVYVAIVALAVVCLGTGALLGSLAAGGCP